MKIKEWLEANPDIDREDFWRKVGHQYKTDEERALTYYMVWMDKPFWWVEHKYDIAYLRFDGKDNPFRSDDYATRVDTTFSFMVERPYDPKEAAWLESEESEVWYEEHKEKMI